MEDKKEYCENLIKKFWDSQIYSQDPSEKLVFFSKDHLDELDNTIKLLKEECADYLSPEVKLEIEKLTNK